MRPFALLEFSEKDIIFFKSTQNSSRKYPFLLETSPLYYLQTLPLFLPSLQIYSGNIELNVSYLFKGNAQFLFLCNPPKSGALQVCITSLQVTQKILTKDIHWLEVITEILSFLQIYSVQCEKNNLSFSNIF